jgi:ABC-2 type transport system ATP-binding protein
MSTTNNIVEIQNLKKYFKNVKAVDGVDLEIKQGEFVALLGPNGAGKTTLVEMIEGIQIPDEGVVKIDNKSWLHHRAELHNIIGLSLQETSFLDKISVFETLLLFATFYKQTEARVYEILELIKLNEKAKARVNNLSGGQRQRLALGIALLNKPQLLLLDEPTTGLDPTARRQIWEILQELKSSLNVSLILTTHYMEEAEYLCDRIIMMHQGKILMQGTLQELLDKNNLKNTLFFEFENRVNTELFKQFTCAWETEGISGKIIVNDLNTDIKAFMQLIEDQNIQLKNLKTKSANLDDLFVLLTGEQLNK